METDVERRPALELDDSASLLDKKVAASKECSYLVAARHAGVQTCFSGVSCMCQFVYH